MRAYKSLPSERMKALGVQNTRTPFPGSLDLIQCKDGEDKLVQDYTKVAGWENPEILDLVQKLKLQFKQRKVPIFQQSIFTSQMTILARAERKQNSEPIWMQSVS